MGRVAMPAANGAVIDGHEQVLVLEIKLVVPTQYCGFSPNNSLKATSRRTTN